MIKLVRLKHFLVSAIFALISSAAFGQSFGNFTVFPEDGVVVLSGSIDSDSPQDFDLALAAAGEIKMVVLRSPGGVVVSALTIAATIKQRQLVTFVEERQNCASACSIIFFAGEQRVALGELGVHQMSSSGSSSLAGLQFVLADVLSAFDAFDVDDRVMQKMLRTPANDMYYFTTAEKEAWGIDRFSALTPEPVRSTFADFPPERYYSGPSVLPDFNGRDKNFRSYRTRIRDGAVSGVNFAGRFSVVEIGCGTSCRFAFVVDVSNGKVFTFPYGGEEQYQLGLVYSTDSRLMRATWREAYWTADQSKDTDTCISQDILWTGSGFEVVSERAFEIKKSSYCSILY
ncbi:hypothetical protein JQX09_19515 [Sulfitobacter pseudonitzschiae]|uniref:Uncharacterized protein n=1 Tax=Pseudosulfitobacter pseudonitzschiae TaxID=1402135 RepID=A0A9Q2S207_9RHOB|nr:hypothetical protein [Pseudosulfitobacter pseudonitzschiae]MBM2294120.1 hypothetical protein [Pseudosulfitobacter pseudonitzschiae]MBM2299044.1 hypothetical protein [Pseudosulfitobacter pseudonitzschiae]MBM2303952.1 hypothetical protein [Pseudosulfitobacter pseudonitzschiae]MBM2313733.1 hypothetical protein [Pseudosulfitobacter pseudonitzschiae]MBM2318648.1 hypothetical protein [Pseudosulfitobacter pseudonitzschiae]